MGATSGQNDLWVFREGHNIVSGPHLIEELRSKVREVMGTQAAPSGLLNTLIRAGQIEAALSDAGSPSAGTVSRLTDALAQTLYGKSDNLAQVALNLNVSVPEKLTICTPEGFSYYALHPIDFGRLALRVGTNGHPAAVLGIRSIGTTLSAVVSAALSTTGIPVERLTVRPTGHPYDRVIHFTLEEQKWIDKQELMGASFLIVDEGPGRSGSTFLSVAEALLQAGVPKERITLLGSRQPDLTQLCSPNGSNRWSQFQFAAVVPDSHSRFQDFTYIGGGEWRRNALELSGEWPTCWPQMERLKFLSPDGRRFWKFEGMGSFGEQVQLCTHELTKSGFGIPSADEGGGFVSYPVIHGNRMRAQDISNSLLENIARYCAFRSAEFRMPPNIPDRLAEMLVHNVQQEFGVELDTAVDDLITGNVLLTDGRMQPHEWITDAGGRLLKTDACAHGNDHFFPGPCDIAWDIAGVAVEWDLSPDALQRLLSFYRQLTGDDTSKRLPVFILAYNVFRLGWCRMAMSSVAGTPDEFGIHRAYAEYRERAEMEILILQRDLRHGKMKDSFVANAERSV